MTTTTPLRRALLVCTDDEPLSHVESGLADGGFDVVRCHSSDAPSFPCAALTAAGCPLAAQRAVDVTVDVRQHPWPYPTPREQGVTCSLQAGVPVVVVGRERHPFAPWATISAESTDRLATRCDQAIRVATAPLQHAAAAAVRRVLARDAHDAPFVVDVTRAQGRILVRIVAKLPGRLAGTAADAAVAAIRAIDARWTSVDVEVVEPV